MTPDIIKNELKIFNERYLENLKSNVFSIDTAVKYLSKRKGKQLRPTLCLIISKSLNNINSKVYTIASLIEMIHVATLIHDDIVDEASLRRGWPSIGRVWKNKISILIGDYIFSKALSTIVELKDINLIKILSDTTNQLSQGEVLQVQESKKNIMTEGVYYKMIEQKTASLFSASCELTALVCSDNKNIAKSLKKFGRYFGIAYQIKDDLNDFLADSTLIGKPVNLDIQKNIITLPYIACLNNMSANQKNQFIAKIKKLSKKRKSKEINKLIRFYDGFKYSKKKMDLYLEKAINSLSEIPKSNHIIDFVENIFYEKK